MNREPRYDEQGLVPVIVQNVNNGHVLMLGYANEASLEATAATGRLTFWSRSRGTLWEKGETSGNTLHVVDIRLDCDADTVLVRVDPAGPTCHTGAATCFDGGNAPAFDRENAVGLSSLWATITSRAAERPAGSYTTALLEGGVDACSRKVAEEATEVLLAAKDHAAGTGSVDRVVEESADLVYHLLVLLAERGLDLADIEEELDRRAG
jgi:phosphoribosyl-ATP pyrophosphohydrolase/phosphoribosyl-AMP cyclohydrolase